MKKLNQKGTAAIEFAIVLPVLLAITFGIIEFGILLYDKAMVTNASREGARAAIAWSDPSFCNLGTVTPVVTTYLQNNLISLGGGAGLTIRDPVLTESTNTTPRTCTVWIDYQYQFIVLPQLLASLLNGGMSDNLTLQAQTIMRMERQSPDTT
jgi:Flp pilus assembly protein TadG